MDTATDTMPIGSPEAFRFARKEPGCGVVLAYPDPALSRSDVMGIGSGILRPSYGQGPECGRVETLAGSDRCQAVVRTRQRC